MSNKEHIKRGLENLKEYEPKPQVWDNIESALQENDKPKIIYWRWITGIAATIAILFVVKGVFKHEMQPAIVEVNMAIDSTDKNTLSQETIKMRTDGEPAPVSPILETPTTGPYDGKAGEAMSSVDVQANQDYNVGLHTNTDSLLTSGNDVFLSGSSAIHQGAVTYQWDFGKGEANHNIQPNLYYDPSTSEPVTLKVDQIQSTDEWALTYSVNGNSTSYVGEGTYTVTTDDEEKTTYKESTNIGYLDDVTTDNDGVADYIDQDASVDRNVQTISSKEISKLPARNVESIATMSHGTILSKSRITGLRKKRKQKQQLGLSSSNIEVPTRGDHINEKYQLILTDSVAGFYPGQSFEPVNTESYYPLIENEYQRPTQTPLSTFGIDVDNASYAVMRTKINSRQVVPKDAVRVEEFINYFDYNYKEPIGEAPFSINLENVTCPWNSKHQLVRIGLKGKDINYNEMQNSNLVFLIDVSGSMDDENKLPLVKKSMKLLVDQMGANDRIAIVTYAGAAGLALESTSCDRKDYIKKKIDKLDAGGSTAGGEGIKLAYNVAVQNLIADGNNRVIMCTDGDFNVGQSSDADMKHLIVNNRNKGVFITVCGFGMGNYQDSKMETIADNGNGNYFYIDTYRESEKVFNREIRATLFTIAKDVKIQVEFNPKHVKAYRLIGYENRKMPPQDFNDDSKDGGELGAGHTVTALYEIIPANSEEEIPGHIELKYQTPNTTTQTAYGNELLTVKMRYKHPKENTSKLIQESMLNTVTDFANASEDFQFASGVALYAQQLRQSKFINQKDFELAERLVRNAIGSDVNGDRQELLQLIRKAKNTYQIYTKE